MIFQRETVKRRIYLKEQDGEGNKELKSADWIILSKGSRE
jgi:hypothetical protein